MQLKSLICSVIYVHSKMENSWFHYLYVISKYPRFFLHSPESQYSLVTKVVKDGVVHDVHTSKMTPNGQTKMTVVGHVVTVLQIFKIQNVI